jgi:hypothetical protein
MGKSLIGQILIQEGKITEEQLNEALEYHMRWGKRIGESLVQLGFINEVELCKTLSKKISVPLIDISKIEPEKITKNLLKIIPIEMARQFRMVPIAIRAVQGEDKLILAASDPTSLDVKKSVEEKVGPAYVVMLAPDRDIDWFIRKYYLGDQEAKEVDYISNITHVEDTITSFTDTFWDESVNQAKDKNDPSKDGKSSQ